MTHRQPYLQPLIKHARSIAKPGMVTVVTLRHDDDCPKLRGGVCVCEPELEIPLANRKQRRAERKKWR